MSELTAISRRNLEESASYAPPPVPGKVTREEEAKLVLEHTVISPALAWTMTVLFLLTIFGVPLSQFGLELARNRAARRADPSGKLWPQSCDVFGTLPSWERVRAARTPVDALNLLPSAEALKAYETDLEKTNALNAWLLPRAQALLTGIGGIGNEQAYRGRDGWLFYRPEVEYVTERGFLDPARQRARKRTGGEETAAVQPDPIAPIVALHQQLAARGITLVVMPAPLKTMIEPERLSGRYGPLAQPLQNPSYAQFVRALEAQGVRYLDVSQPLLDRKHATGEAQFLQTDTHWTPGAMAYAAQLLAGYLGDNALLPARDRVAYTRRPQTVANIGDIAGMLKLLPGQTLYQPQAVEVEQVFTPDGAPWAPSRDADVLLLGDSFCNIYSLGGMNWGEGAGFAEQLSYQLGRPVDKIVQNAGGAFATREQLAKELRAGKDRLAGKKVVIYEFAMRELAIGDWRTIDLPEPSAPQQAAPVAPVEPSPTDDPSPVTPTEAKPITVAGVAPATIDPSKGDSATLTLTLPETSAYRVRVENAGGQPVRELAPEQTKSAGTYKHTWNGKDGRNAVLPDGVYTIVVERTDTEVPRATATVTVKTATPSTPVPVPPAGDLVVSGRIKEVAAVPAPGTVPYKDCVVAVYLTDVKATRGTLPATEILVYTWGMRDNTLAAAARYRAGQTLTLSLTPWEKVAAKYDGYTRREVADENAMLLDVYWAE